MQTTIQQIDNQRKVITYYSLAGIISFARDKNVLIDETPVSFSVSIFTGHVRSELHIYYKT